MYIYPSGASARDVYDRLMRADPAYGATNHGHGTEQLCRGYKSLLDVGCGRSRYTLEVQRRYGLKIAACDLSPVAVETQRANGVTAREADLSVGLPYFDDEFEVVSCFDTLEHIQTSSIHTALRELGRVASELVIMRIAYRPAVLTGINGEDLHLTVASEGWWIEQINQYIGKPVQILNAIVVEL